MTATQIFSVSLKHVRFLPCQHRGAGINATRVRAKPCVHYGIIPGHSRREVPVRAVDIVNPGIQ